MREYSKKPESQSRTLDSNPKASRQAPINVILQRYKEQNIQQYASAEEEEPLQGKFGEAQREEIDEDELLQGKFESNPTTEQKPIQQEERPNNTGLPDNLKKGIENHSGYSMDDVRVHYNSDKPTQLNALAYAQGTNIHIAPGQEKHLPHEAWHVVQQKQGRVQPTMQMQGVNVNDNEGLEKEADELGEKIIQRETDNVFKTNSFNTFTSTSKVVQCFKILEVTKPFIPSSRKAAFMQDFKSKHEREPTEIEIDENFTKVNIIYDSTITNYEKEKEKIPYLIFALKNVLHGKYEIKYNVDEPKIENIIDFIFRLAVLYNQVMPQKPTSKEPSLAPHGLLKANVPKMPQILGVVYKDNIENVIEESLPALVDIIDILEYPSKGGQIEWSEDVFEFLGDSVGTRTPSVMDQSNIDLAIKSKRKIDWEEHAEKISAIKTLGGSLLGSPTKEQIDFIRFPKQRVLLSLIEGGNMLTGNDYMIIGKDSLSVIMSEYKIDVNKAIGIIEFDFGIKRENIFFIKQLDYHIDTYLQLLNGKSILMSKPKDIDDALYISAKQELEAYKFTVIETAINSAINGEFVKDKYGKLIFITNKCSDPHKKEFANLLFKEVAELTAVFFTDKELNDKGGIGCMFKGK